MQIFDNLGDLIQCIQDRKCKKICIDGYPGSGKSTLAEKLGREMKCSVVALDPEKGVFMKWSEYFSMERTERIYEDKLVNRDSYILEGCFMREILNNPNIQHDCIIYVKKVNQNDLWQYEMLSGTEMHYDDNSCLSKNMIVYHNKYLPQHNSNIVFKNVVKD